MSEWLRLVLLIGLGGLGATLLAMGLARLMAEDQRLLRTFRQALETRPDASLIAHGSGRGAALSLASRRIVTAWDAGRWHMVYPLEELLGAELDLDGEVAARAMRGEPRRMLDRAGAGAAEVRLRLLFDEPRYPDFELLLWPSRQARGAPTKPREAISEANRWIARVEALLRRTGGALTLAQPPSISRTAPPSQPPTADDRAPWEDAAEDDEDAFAD